jgi:N-acetyl-gamma-glutamyl-phosphate reductase
MTIRAGVYGAGGYTGYELVGLILAHPEVELAFATSERNAGRSLSEVFACRYDVPLVAADDAPLDGVEVAFLCLPHGASAQVGAKLLESGLRVVDLSADFRLDSPALYAEWYPGQHPAPHLLPAVYGLTEFNRTPIAEADLVANPGCYPTSVLLALAPLAKAGALAGTHVIADSKSGVSGAGRDPKLTTSFVEVADNFSPYKIGRAHRHLPEMEQELAKLTNGSTPQIIFTPHLLPVPRGILSTLYVTTNGTDGAGLQSLFEDAYADEPFIQVLPAGQVATLAHVTHTNRCALSISPLDGGQAVIVSCIDNLVKGAAGQALQNANVMFGLDETMGLL